MCYAGGCHPECDNCKPKYLYCPQCGQRCFLVKKSCPSCGREFTSQDKEEARARWAATHIGKTVQPS